MGKTKLLHFRATPQHETMARQIQERHGLRNKSAAMRFALEQEAARANETKEVREHE